MSQQEIINEINDKSNKRYVRAVTKGRKPNYLSVSIPSAVAKKVGLSDESYVKIYVDKLNNLCFTKLDI
jgi:hypothetical protein